MLTSMNLITLDSCHSTWIFDTRQLRFCRILRGIAVGQRRISTEWRPYWELEIDPHGKTFTVVAQRDPHPAHPVVHPHEDCVQCGGSHTTELSLEDISRAVA